MALFRRIRDVIAAFFAPEGRAPVRYVRINGKWHAQAHISEWVAITSAGFDRLEDAKTFVAMLNLRQRRRFGAEKGVRSADLEAKMHGKLAKLARKDGIPWGTRMN